MLSREDFYMIKQMRKQGAYIVDIATQVGCSERTVRRYPLPTYDAGYMVANRIEPVLATPGASVPRF